MSKQKPLEQNLIDDDLKDALSNDIEHTPTDKSGDETQRNEQSFTEEGTEDISRKRRLHRKHDESSQ